MIDLKIDWKKLAFFVLVPIALGALVGWVSGSFRGFDGINMPSFAPPKILFPIVWSVLYILMGISRYLIFENGDDAKAVGVYNVQLAINLLWSFFFFIFKWYLFSFLWIVLLIVVVVLMIMKFYSISKTSALLQIPYLLWIVFAAVLNYAIYVLN